jgi:hypothetical protein
MSLDTDVAGNDSSLLELFRNNFIRYTATGLMLVSLGVAVPGCSKGPNQESESFQKKYKNSTPEEAFESFIKALKNQDLDGIEGLIESGKDHKLFFETRSKIEDGISLDETIKDPEKWSKLRNIDGTKFEITERRVPIAGFGCGGRVVERFTKKNTKINDPNNKGEYIHLAGITYEITDSDRSIMFMKYEHINFIKTKSGWKLHNEIYGGSILLWNLMNSNVKQTYVKETKVGPKMSNPEETILSFFNAYKTCDISNAMLCMESNESSSYDQMEADEKRQVDMNWFCLGRFLQDNNVNIKILRDQSHIDDSYANIRFVIDSPNTHLRPHETSYELTKVGQTWKISKAREPMIPSGTETEDIQKYELEFIEKKEPSQMCPSDVMQIYVHALRIGDLKKLEKFSTGKNLDKLVNAIAEMGEDRVRNATKEMFFQYTLDHWGGEVIQDTRARSSAYFKRDYMGNQCIFDFLNVDGIWKVSNLDNNEGVETNVRGNLLATSKKGKSEYTVQWTGELYGITRGRIIPNARDEKYEVFKYSNGDWKPLGDFYSTGKSDESDSDLIKEARDKCRSVPNDILVKLVEGIH